MINFEVSASETARSEDYPVGPRVRGNADWWLEEKRGKGVRICRQTEHPKKGKAKPKKGVYTSEIVRFGELEDGRVCIVRFQTDFNGSGQLCVYRVDVQDGAFNNLYSSETVNGSNLPTDPGTVRRFINWAGIPNLVWSLVPITQCRACSGRGHFVNRMVGRDLSGNQTGPDTVHVTVCGRCTGTPADEIENLKTVLQAEADGEWDRQQARC